MSDTSITLRGRIGTDLRVNRTAGGQLVSRFRLAVPKWRVNDAGEFSQEQTLWYSVVTWGRLAQNLVASVAKGDPVIVHARPSAQAWTDREGKIRTELVMTAHTVGHDLSKGTAEFVKGSVESQRDQQIGAPSWSRSQQRNTGNPDTFTDEDDAPDSCVQEITQAGDNVPPQIHTSPVHEQTRGENDACDSQNAQTIADDAPAPWPPSFPSDDAFTSGEGQSER